MASALASSVTGTQPFSASPCWISATTRFSPIGLFQLVPSLMAEGLQGAEIGVLVEVHLDVLCERGAGEAQRGRDDQCAYLHDFFVLPRP